MAGTTVTIDALDCQSDIAKAVIESDAHYILAVKENREHLLNDIKEAFTNEKQSSIATSEQKHFGHGRIEKRTCAIIANMDWICKADKWKNLSSIIKVTAERTHKENGSYQKRALLHIRFSAKIQ